MATTSFAAQINAFRDKTKAQMKAIVATSVQDLLEEAQRPVAQGGRMPVDTGFLRGSLASLLNGTALGQGATSYELVVAQIEPGDVAVFQWTASYAKRIEFGFVGEDSMGRSFNQQGRFFVDGAAQQWPAFVAANVARLK